MLGSRADPRISSLLGRSRRSSHGTQHVGLNVTRRHQSCHPQVAQIEGDGLLNMTRRSNAAASTLQRRPGCAQAPARPVSAPAEAPPSLPPSPPFDLEKEEHNPFALAESSSAQRAGDAPSAGCSQAPPLGIAVEVANAAGRQMDGLGVVGRSGEGCRPRSVSAPPTPKGGFGGSGSDGGASDGSVAWYLAPRCPGHTTDDEAAEHWWQSSFTQGRRRSRKAGAKGGAAAGDAV